jgi:2,5-furandicarboxylate decarboxylase 1
MITKRIVIVDDDIDVYNLEDIEWAIWTRLSRQEKVMTMDKVKSWELERCVDDEQRSVRVGIDGTMDMDTADKLLKPIIPGATNIHLDDYLQTS